ncbi:MAG TPA: ATPase [Gammaproteobacteria bacterium]|nr:ATPase [Gammaproteobacteria bacterium]
MSILQEIFKWSESLPPWQGDAIRRLFEKGALSETDLDDLTALAKVAHGIPDPAGRVPQPLRAEQVPVPPAGGDTVRLLSVKGLKHVNAIPPGQALRFAKHGLTVVYGDNGAGKSGYTRVLKRACRARDQAERVLPNANLADKDHGTPEAVFEIDHDGKVQEVSWREGEEPPPILSSIAVFDTRCARIYLDEENEVAFVPYGLDIPTGLAKACAAIKQRLHLEASKLTFNPLDFKDLEGDTEVGRAIAQLPGKADAETFERLAALSRKELDQLAALREALKQSDPAARAKALGRLKQRLEAAAEKANKLYDALSDEALVRAGKLDQEWRSAKAAADLAAKALTDDRDLLPGTGSEAWKRMFEAAREYSEQCAYPGHAFPYVEQGARCPLCQQELTDGIERLRRFDAFIRDKTEQTAEAKRSERERAVTYFQELDTSPLLDDATLSEIQEMDPAVAELLAQASQRIMERHGQVLAAFDSGDWDTVQSTLPPCTQAISGLTATIQAQIETLTKAAQGDHAKMQIELRELEARQKLGPRLPAILRAIEREKQRQAIERCAQSINTHGISRKATELTEKAVTKELEQALNREFQDLQAGHLRVVLTASTVKGSTRHKLRLDMPARFELSGVLSEGEQRAIAIASFLAEASITPGNGTLVFDDPVSSLDHARRELIARRLAAEATKRQVIVFTHDLYFLNLLLEEADARGLQPLTQMVVQGVDGPGLVIDDLPFQGKGTKARVGQLRQLHQRAEKLWREKNQADYDRLVREGYRMLRDAWERAVEEVLFNRTVERFRKGVETNRLRRVVIEPQDQEDVDRGMTKCSNFAHDNPLAAGVSVPAPDEFLADIEALEAFRKRVEGRRQK